MMNMIIVTVISMAVMILVGRLLKRSIYITKIIKGFAFIMTAISILAAVKSSFYDIFNFCERISTENGVFVFMMVGSMTATVLFLAYCWAGQTAAGREITF